MGKAKGNKKSSAASPSNGAAPAVDISLHGETLQMIKVRHLSLTSWSCEYVWLGLVGGLTGRRCRRPRHVRLERALTARGSLV